MKAATRDSCWSPSKIRKDRFSLRGVEGSIRTFEIAKVSGCVFQVKIQYTTATGATKVLDYNADFSRGSSPIFIRYNAPP